MKRILLIVSFLCLTLTFAISTSLARENGVFSADVEMTVPGLNGGFPFPGVINPDLPSLYVAGLVEDDGFMYGDYQNPFGWNFMNLPVYAIVPRQPDLVVPLNIATFTPWDYSLPLFEDPPLEANRNFSLARVGTLDLYNLGIDNWLSFRDTVVNRLYDLNSDGIVEFAAPPTGLPDHLHYPVNQVDLIGDPLNALTIS